MMIDKLKSRKSVMIAPIRVSPAEYRQLLECAEQAGGNLSLWIRRTLFRAAGIPLSDAVRPEGKPPRED